MIRLGVIGLGLRVGHFIRETMNSVDPDFRVVGVVDPGEKASREKMRECDQDAVFYNSIDEMVRNSKPDALLVGTRCNLHTPIAVEIEKYHLPVFLEKPVAITMEQALLLEDTYRKSSTPVLVSFPLRMTPLHRRAVEMIRNGAVGDVLHITGLNYVPYGTVYYEYGYRNYDITGGLFLQKATHDFDYIMDLAGSPITSIQANWVRGRVFGGDKPEDLTCANCPEAGRCPESPENRKRDDAGGVLTDHLCLFSKACGNVADGTINEEASNSIFEFANGAIGTYAQLVFVRREGVRGAAVSGPKGKVSFDWYRNELNYVEHHTPFSTTVKPGAGLDHFGGDIELARNFFDMIRNGAKPASTIQDGMRSVFTCLAAREAAQTGAKVAVRQVEW